MDASELRWALGMPTQYSHLFLLLSIRGWKWNLDLKNDHLTCLSERRNFPTLTSTLTWLTGEWKLFNFFNFDFLKNETMGFWFILTNYNLNKRQLPKFNHNRKPRWVQKQKLAISLHTCGGRKRGTWWQYCLHLCKPWFRWLTEPGLYFLFFGGTTKSHHL